MKIWIQNRQKRIPLDLRKVRRAVREILANLALPDAEISISFVDDAEIQGLNQRYLRRNKPTNVIAFPMREGGRNVSRKPCSALHPNRLGDVVISAETAQRQSSQFGLNGEEMILFLIIHGILHLLGYDHEQGSKEARKMTRKQKELFYSVVSKNASSH